MRRHMIMSAPKLIAFCNTRGCGMKLQHNQHGTHNICHAHSTFIWLPQKRLYHSSYVTPQVLRPQVTQRNFYDIANWPRQLARGFEILKWLFFLLCCPSAGLWSCASSFCIFCWLRDSRDSTRMVFGQRFLWERLEQRVCWLIFPGICNVCCTQAQVYDTRSSHKSRRGNFVTHYAHSHHGSKIGSAVGWFLNFFCQDNVSRDFENHCNFYQSFPSWVQSKRMCLHA